MGFPTEDNQWMQVRAFLEQQAQPLAALLAPNEFLECFPGTYPYHLSYQLPAEQYDFVVFHKAMLGEIEPSLIQEVLQRFQPVFGNEVFVVYAKAPQADTPPLDPNDIKALLEQIEAAATAPHPLPFQEKIAAVITTYNRPWCLERSLPQVLALGVPVVVVDDASSPGNYQANQRITSRYQVPLLRLPSHREQSSAITMGVSYWLADPDIAWISYFQDNVTVRPNTLKVLRSLQDAEQRPLLVGRDDPSHATLKTETIAGQPVLLKRSMSGGHFHAHRDYWAAVLPIPTPYLNAPKPNNPHPRTGGIDEDWWITAWAPESVVKRGGYVVCVPDLVTPFEATSKPLVVKEAANGKASEPAPLTLAASNDLSLDGVKVLVDGYNLQLTKGTGIKTYGLSLIEGLDRMGAQVDILLSRNGYKTNEILDEVFFFDNQGSRQDWVTLGKWALKSLSPFYRAKRRKSFAGLVVKRGQYTEDFLKYATSFSLPQCYDLANGLYDRLRLTTSISVAEPVDIWHATYPLPMIVRGAKKITTVHDLIPLRLPYATLDGKKIFFNKIHDALKESAVTITVSENSKQDLLTYYDVDPDRIIVTYQPIALKPLLATDEEVKQFLRRYGLQAQNYILFVGAIEPKKNVGRLLDAYASMDIDMPLVIVGKKGWLWEDELGKATFMFDNKESQKKVKLLEYVSTESLRYIYRGAYCLVFPSLYEGFGLPPLEAMNFGCPVITSNVSCLPEICGSAALYVDPYSVRDIQDKLEQLLGDPQLRQQLVEAGKLNAQAFSMENYVKRLYKAYTTALSV